MKKERVTLKASGFLYRGAEAVISEKDNTIIKERIKKPYRLTEIDEKLRKQRTKTEASLLREAARAGVNVPKILQESDFTLVLEKINGKMIKDMLDKNNMPEICKGIGQSVAKLHSFDIIHGDLTTSNMIIIENEMTVNPFQLYLIDFGLGFRSQKAEDKATDLHVLKEALEAKHHRFFNELWSSVILSYKKNSKFSSLTLKQLEKVESRGRYKQQY